jgi:hypothetical protein
MTAVPWPLHAPIVFVVAAVGDWVWAHWTLTVNAKRPLAAAWWAAAIVLVGIVSIDAYITSRLYVIPVAAGCAVGTYWTVKRERTRDEA